MKLPVDELASESGIGYLSNVHPDMVKKFAELVVRACADHVLESSDRYRKEYFANKILELIDGS